LGQLADSLRKLDDRLDQLLPVEQRGVVIVGARDLHDTRLSGRHCRDRDVLFVRGGTLDDPSGVTPDVHIFTRSKLSWIVLPAFEVYYDRNALWPAASLERLKAIKAQADSEA